MIFADKLIQLRKRSGWSQEELADQMHVTRQSISKWEGGQSIPDIEKIIRLSELFGVSTDYLLKDELEGEEPLRTTVETDGLRRVSMEEANAFLTAKQETARPVSLGVLLCMLSPVCLLLLGAISDLTSTGLQAEVSVGLGLVALVIFVVAAVALFVSSGSKTSAYAYLEKEPFETAYGVSGMVKERQERFRTKYMQSNVLVSCLCIASLIPLFCSMFLTEQPIFVAISIPLLLIIAGIDVFFFVQAGIIWTSFQKILQEGEYTKQQKEKNAATETFSAVYWMLATAAYLAYSFISGDWSHSWILWPVVAVIYPAILLLIESHHKKGQ